MSDLFVIFMKIHLFTGKFFTSIFLVVLYSCRDSNEASNDLVKEGIYQTSGEASATLNEFSSKEPVRTYLAIQKRLSEGNIKFAAHLTTNPSQFIKVHEEFRSRVGKDQFCEIYKSSEYKYTFNAAYHDGDQSLLIVDTGKTRGAVFFYQRGSEFLQIEAGSSITVSQALRDKFYLAKNLPGSILYDRDLEKLMKAN
ncbi:hypothetical protein [Rubritalea sp.]|uniref:hypothetical protein n=1 Tax=Rubritalea sp. TaxID=2109375 RepID=UPI003EF555E1